MPQVTLFVSAVSNEFAEDPKLFPDRVRGPGDYRTYLRDKLTGPDVSVKVQEDFIAGGVLTLDKLVLYMKECDAVIQLVGDMTGAVASDLAVEALFESEPALPRNISFLATPDDAAKLGVSYTQWEGYLAHHYGKRLIVCAAEPSAPRAAKHALDAGERKRQDAHLARLKQLERYPEVTFASREELVIEVLRTLRTILPPAKRESLPAAPLRLPYASLGELFIGREDFLEGIRASVAKARKAGGWPKQVVHGLGGMGKTRLAVEYAWRYRDEYTAVLLVNGESPEALDRELASLGGVLQLESDDATPEPQRTQLALDWLRNHPGWLLVIDNVDSEDSRTAVAARLPDWSNGHLLITGRMTRWPRDVEPLDLRVLSPDDATRFLLDATANHRLLRDDDASQASALANEELGALCLALEQAAAYINKLELSFEEYRARWATNAKDVRKRADKSLMRYHEEKDVSLSVATTWQTTVDHLTKGGTGLLRMLSWLAPEGIPLALLEHESMAEQLRLLTDDKASDVEEAVAELRGFSLLSRRQSGRFESAGQVHRLVQLITRDSLADPDKRRTLEAMLAVIGAYASEEPEHFRRSMMDALPPHLDAVLAHGEARGLTTSLSPVLRERGEQFHNLALYASAEAAFRRALAIDERELGPQHIAVALDLSGVANVLLEVEQFREAEPLFRRALAITEATYGESDLHVAGVLSDLSLMLSVDERYLEAEPLITRAIEINVANHGADHHTSVRFLEILARVLWRTDRLAEGVVLNRRALAIAERFHGVDSLDTSTALGNLAVPLNEAGELEESEQLYRRQLAIFERMQLSTHPNYGLALNNLGMLFLQQGRWAEAEVMLRQSLSITERVVAETHSNTAALLSAIARALSMLGRRDEEELLLRRLLAIRIHHRGDTDAEVSAVLNRLGASLYAQSRLEEAEVELRQALAIDEALFGDNDSHTIRDLGWLARTVGDRQRFEEAESLYRRAIEASDIVHGTSMSQTAVPLLDRSRVLREMGLFAEAEAPLRRALSLYEATTPPVPAVVAVVNVELAQLMEKLGRAEEAPPMLRRAVELIRGLPEAERAGFDLTLDAFALIRAEIDGEE
jgi:tetratricopeptide (TPR) repeat protein